MYQLFADQNNDWINKSYQRPSSYILQIPSSHLPHTHRDSSKTTCIHSKDTLQTLSRHPSYTQETPSKHSPDTLKIPPINSLLKKDGQRVGGRWVAVGWVGGFITIIPRCGSILQAGTCQILSLAENPRWSRVWQLF